MFSGMSFLGYIDKTGKMIIPSNQNWFLEDKFSGGFALVQEKLSLKENTCGYIDKHGKFISGWWYQAGEFRRV